MAMTATQKRKKTEDCLVDLMLCLTEDLLQKMKDHTASPQDVSNAIKLLQNNDITIAIDKGEALPILSEDLPFHGEFTVSN